MKLRLEIHFNKRCQESWAHADSVANN